MKMKGKKQQSGRLVFVSIIAYAILAGLFFGLHKTTIKNFQEQSIRLNALSNQIETLETRHAQDIEILQKSIVPKKLVVTAYTASVNECDSDPKMTASMKKVRPGIIAVSRDLFEEGWVFGKKVYIEDHGIFEIADLMNERHENRIDIFIGQKKTASKFGKKELLVALLPDEEM